MRLVSTLTRASLSAAVLLAISTQANAAVDAKLLDMLRANGSINAAQHAELKAELESEKQAQQVAAAEQAKKNTSFEQKVAWAAKTQIKGDVRLRHESINVDGSTDGATGAAGGPPADRNQDRQRVRARVGVYSEINPQVDGGIRIATGSSADSRSTNQSLDGAFTKKSLWLDQAYLDWHPTAIKDLHLIGGKMAQPWVSMGDVIWDGDINPEGVAATYKMPLGGAELFGSAGYYVLTDNVDGEGRQFNHDLRLYAGQAGAKFALGDSLKWTLGGSIYSYDNDGDTAVGGVLAANGNGYNEFTLYEGFTQLDISGLPLPLSVYGQYVLNGEAERTATVGKQDTAWLAGIKTKFAGFGLDYNYRDVQRNAVVGAFTDSDFANGFTGSRGHKVKLGYEIDKNFAVGATYFLAESDVASATRRDADVRTLQVDLEAKF